MRAFRVGAVFLLGELPGAGGGIAQAEEKASPEFERIKSLAGEWEGSALMGEGETARAKAVATVAAIRVVSAGSAVMLVTDPGTPHEMVTMFHRDDASLMATHYCAAMNQPRMKALPSKDPTKLVFEFVDGTNLGAHPGRMQRLVLTLPDREHHTQEWNFLENGKSATSTFQLHRKK